MPSSHSPRTNASAADSAQTGPPTSPLRTPLVETAPDEPQTNLAIRVRRSLDFRLTDLVHEFKRENVRTSKVEMIEMLLSELPAGLTDDLWARLEHFRAHTPRRDA